MDRRIELDLMDEFFDLKSDKSAYLDPGVERTPVSHYTDTAHFHREVETVFNRRPLAVAHVSELASPGNFLRRDIANRSVLITRTKSGDVKAFHNVCRHRGTRLVDADKGCKHRFSCPYHAWTYANSGELIAAPHFEQGFGELKKSDLGLKPIPCTESLGFVWINLAKDGDLNMDAYFDDLTPELTALGIAELEIADETVRDCKANWKILVEGGIESYHFKVTHRNTIGPYFEDNMSTYRTYGEHMRSMLPRETLKEMRETPRERWRLRDHANVLYTLFPNSQILVQQDHMIWISQIPLAPDLSRLRMVTLAPGPVSTRKDYWQKNHAITVKTLNEDFDIGETIQSGLMSGANEHMIFGRFEGALARFNQTIDRAMKV